MPAAFPDAWRSVLAAHVGPWPLLDESERSRLEAIAARLIATKRWEAAQGFELTDEVQVTIAGLASLLVLALPDDAYDDVGTIIVHRSSLVLDGPHSMVPGLLSDEAMPILGQASFRGPVVIAWDAVVDDVRAPGRGHNVVFHEFAHKLDMADGTVDGTPVLADRATLDTWVEVCTRAYEAVAEGRGGRSLDPYASVNAGEFFAVATEAFFDGPQLLRHEHPDLYDVLAAFYRQDPAARLSSDG